MSDYTPEELMVQIFSRLPTESLFRFRCISRSWDSRISNSDFIWLHTKHTILSKPPIRTIIRYFSKTQRTEIYSIQLTDALPGIGTEVRRGAPFCDSVLGYYRIVGICNGVLCLSDDLFGYEYLLVLWNPAINRYLTLPKPPLFCDNLGTYMSVLGFGFAIKTRDYKVVRITYAHDTGYLVPPNVEIYALSSGIWNGFDGFIPKFGVIQHLWRQAVVCGKVHWTAFKITGDKRKVENLIMVFDLNDEIFQELSLPEILVNGPPTNLNAAECRESLAVYQYDTPFWSSSCSIWVMKQYGDTESWSKEYNVALDDQCLGMVLGFHSDSSILLTEVTDMLATYNPETKKKLCLDILAPRYSFYFGTYQDSIVLLDKGELLSPLYLSSDETDDDEDEDELKEKDAEIMDPQLWETWMRLNVHQYFTGFLGF